MIKIKIRWNKILNKIRVTQSALRWTIPLVLSLIKDDLGHLSVSLEMLLHAIEIILLNLQNNPESGGPLQECSGQGVSCLCVSGLYIRSDPSVHGSDCTWIRSLRIWIGSLWAGIQMNCAWMGSRCAWIRMNCTWIRSLRTWIWMNFARIRLNEDRSVDIFGWIVHGWEASWVRLQKDVCA